MNTSHVSPLQVETIQVIKLWENPEGTKCTRVTVALINGYRRATIGKFFRILNEDEANRLGLPHKQWIPEKKGKHLCLAPYEIQGLNDNLKQILESLEEAGHFVHELERRATAPGPGRADQRAAFYTAGTAFGKCAAPVPTKKRGRKPKGNGSAGVGNQANAQEDYDSGYGSEVKRQGCENDADISE
jgi:hypothetical protein